MNTFFESLLRRQQIDRRFLCIGLDLVLGKIPQHLLNDERSYIEKVIEPSGKKIEAIESFLHSIIDATHDIALCYKPNLAFFEGFGPIGITILQKVIAYAHGKGALVILDFKRGDIETSNEGSVRLAFDFLKADAVTVSPYMGWKAMTPFMDRKEKGIFVLCRTSNPGSEELQKHGSENIALFQKLQENIVDSSMWNYNGNCGLVFGATQTEDMEGIRDYIGEDAWVLSPGVGAQNGDLEKALGSLLNTSGERVIVNASRSIIYASGGVDYIERAREEAEKLHMQISAGRDRALQAMKSTV